LRYQFPYMEQGSKRPDPETKQRYQNALHHILDHGIFPGAIVAMNIPSGLTILDGSCDRGADEALCNRCDYDGTSVNCLAPLKRSCGRHLASRNEGEGRTD
jgi:hypothetical protein